MKLLKQLTIALAIACSIGSFSSAFAAGKIENATIAEVKVAADAALTHAEEALASLKAGSDKEVVMEHIKAARQESKRIEVGRLDLKRNQASGKLKDARVAIGKDDKAKAEELLAEGVKLYQEIKDAL